MENAYTFLGYIEMEKRFAYLVQNNKSLKHVDEKYRCNKFLKISINTNRNTTHNTYILCIYKNVKLVCVCSKTRKTLHRLR